MTTPRTIKRIETLVWVLIFGGLMTLVYGLSLQRYEAGEGMGFITVGAVLAIIGAMLIAVRSRLQVDVDPSSND